MPIVMVYLCSCVHSGSASTRNIAASLTDSSALIRVADDYSLPAAQPPGPGLNVGDAPPKGGKPIGEKLRGDKNGDITIGDRGEIGSRGRAALGGGGLDGCTGKEAHRF